MRNKARRLLTTAALIAVGLPAGLAAIAASGSADAGPARVAHARLVDTEGRHVGTIIVRPLHGGVVVSGRVAHLAPGFHGFHVHGVGVCDPDATDASGVPSPFSSAGGHFNPTGLSHGHHAGDLPSLLVSRDGTGAVWLRTDRFTVDTLLDDDGSAVIVHAGPDNVANIPPRYRSSLSADQGPDAVTRDTGDSGARVSCGAMTRKQSP